MNFKQIQDKWQKRWQEADIFRVEEDDSKEKFYCLEMYPYPSGSSLHVGHIRNFTIGDIVARYKRMKGFNVLYPMGFDAFGLPAENAAIKEGIHPSEYTRKAIEVIKRQMNEVGLSYDWSRTLASCDENYYRWNQWFFLKMLEKGIAVRKKAPINWCNQCQTVLANEQVEQGKCWRCDSEVELKPLEQWFLKITDYADRLLHDLDKLPGWPKKIATMQKNWIGRSEGSQVDFKIDGLDQTIPVFTTRVDTLWGVTFLVYAPEHPIVSELVKDTEFEQPVKDLVKKVVMENKFDRTAENTEKEGMFIGRYAINPVTNEKVPIYIGNFVVMEYGAGAVMAVPAHDQRDFEFAKKYDIPIKVVIAPDAFALHAEKMSRAYTDDGTLVHSAEFDGLPNRLAIEEIQKYLEAKGFGKKITQYKIRDWLISRQRYWGTPIPVVYCEQCGVVPVLEDQLPVKLPLDVKFTGEGNPLKTSESFLNTTCPTCGGHATRETDTMDGFMDSCWYFLGFTTRDRSSQPFDKEKVNYWMPVDQYVGGAEHAVMHLLYARFFAKILHDMGMIDFDEPFTRLFNQGIVYKDGVKMSKSKGNVVTQEEIAEKYGIDSARYFLMSLASAEKTVEWEDAGVVGAHKTLNRIMHLSEKKIGEQMDPIVSSKMHSTVKLVTSYLEEFKFNLSLIEIASFAKRLDEMEEVPKEALDVLIRLLTPFCPHAAEEMWERLGNENFVAQCTWPECDESKINFSLEATEDVLLDVIEDIKQVKQLAKLDAISNITLIVSASWKYEFFKKLKELLEVQQNPGEIIKEFMQSDLKQYGQEITKMIPLFVKNRSKLPRVIMDVQEEVKLYTGIADKLYNQFGSQLHIVMADQTDNPKKKQAMPSKPAIILE